MAYLMPDKEKVIKGLEVCTGSFREHSCSECPYYNDCERRPNRPKHFLLIDAQSILKAQNEVIDDLLKVGYPHDFQREEPWIVDYMNQITNVIRKAVRLKNDSLRSN